MVGECAAVLRPDIFPERIPGMIKYDSSKPQWAGVVGYGGKCDCKRGDVRVWMRDVMERYK
jgi:hypothetical protein